MSEISLRHGDWPKLALLLRRLQKRVDNFIPRRISQSGQPSGDDVAEGEVVIWHDSDDSKVYWLYNDADEGYVKIEMI